MIKITIRVDGRDVCPEELSLAVGQSLAAAVHAAGQKHVRERTVNHRCAVHGTPARFRSTPDGFLIEACCEALRKEVERSLA